MIHEGQSDKTAFILNTVYFSSYKLTPGDTRQMMNFRLADDILGLRSILLRTSDHTIEPITPVKASEVQASELLNVFALMPLTATTVLWAASRAEAMLVEHLVRLDRRHARKWTTHLLLQLAARLRLVGLGGKMGYACHLSEYMLTKALGFGAVHINRVLREPREGRLVRFSK